jgi:uncharacterized protein YndB with AHSA1/START domain
MSDGEKNMLEVDVIRSSTASCEQLFELLAEAETWTEWAGYDEASIVSGSGVGEVRFLRSARVMTVERITALEPPRRLAYELVSGLPVVDFTAVVTLSRLSDGTSQIRWRARFKPAIPTTGRLIRSRLEGILSAAADGLARTAEAGDRAARAA